MSVGFGIFVVIMLIRWVLPSVWGFFTNSTGNAFGSEWQRRGRVLGHFGPDPRSFKGRAGRREWWLTMLGNTLASAIVGAVPTIGTLLTLPWIIATLATNARRLHDLSMSAWLQLIPMAFGLAIAVFYFYLGGPDNPPEPSWVLASPAGLFTIASAVTAFVYLAFYVWIGFVPGRKGSNVFGEADPA
ncbi:DUF805 domain-containing protein [Candidatus Viadribacter manganicus]|uniref:DUF805 domain-containing protein n=1 Tax=Candidatus Viadribacter manganicus TaxID=1759059 RepID=A0A1B1AEN1_9PROT|nr:DUF805 domain-containing protein [Candidatus Viadribacter manganicus]ANP45018.1 hypothetical protein ATE48_03320 [Candidatus Viadribacter manganicus]